MLVLAPAFPPPSVRRAIARTAQAETVVRGLRAAWPGVMVLAVAGLAGPFVSAAPPAGQSLFALAAIALSAFLLMRGALRLKRETGAEAARRMEVAAGLGELSPLTARDDWLASGDSALWQRHQRALADAGMQLSRPAPPRRDARDGLRAGALLVALGLIATDPAGAARGLAFDVSPLAGDAPLAVEVWIEPPSYTGRPAQRLVADMHEVEAPAGSVVRVRVDGARGAPVLRGPFKSVRLARGASGAWEGRADARASGEVRVERFGKRASWRLTTVPDRPPVLVAVAPIVTDARGRLDIAFTASDDYAITGASLRVRALGATPELAGKTVRDTPITLDSTVGEDGARRVFLDVTRHPFAGMRVEAHVVVRDALGQEAVSPPSLVSLPERAWSNPLALALQEQRLLILREHRPWGALVPRLATLIEPRFGETVRADFTDPSTEAPPGIARAARMMRAILATRDEGGLDPLAAVGLRVALGMVDRARTPLEAHRTDGLLWGLALQADASGRTPAQQRLDDARRALEQALRGGASDDEIRELTQEFREAMRERLTEMAEQAQSGVGEGQGGGSAGGGMQGEGGEQISGGDIEDMIRELEENGTGGAREEALSQMQDLDRLMQNLRVAPGGGEAAGTDDAMREQRELSDETELRGNGAQGQEPQPDLAERQDALARRVEPGERPQDQAGQSRAEAAQAMREAADALRRGDLGSARAAQDRASAALRSAAQASSGGQGGDGSEDPLGRPGARPDDGRGTKVPNQTERRRARDIRDELRKRQADPKRDETERGYLDRLLGDGPDR